MNKYIDFSDEVSKALAEHQPIVAIETGGTFEGIPYPENAQTALKVMDAIRKTGATPAYVSNMDGRVKVGMTEEEQMNFQHIWLEQVELSLHAEWMM